MQPVDQTRALQRARRNRYVYLGLFLALVGVDAAVNRGPLRVWLIGWILAVAGAAIVADLSGYRRKQLERQVGPLEVRLPAPAPAELDATYEHLRRHMRNWWLIHVRDCRGWTSIYLAPIPNAPLRLPFEFHVDGADIVLRGSGMAVEAAAKHLTSPRNGSTSQSV